MHEFPCTIDINAERRIRTIVARIISQLFDTHTRPHTDALQAATGSSANSHCAKRGEDRIIKVKPDRDILPTDTEIRYKKESFAGWVGGFCRDKSIYLLTH